MYATITLAILILGNAWLFHFGFWRRFNTMLHVANASQSEEVDAKYRFLKFDLLGLAMFFVIAPAIGIGWYYIIKGVVEAFQHSSSDVLVSLPPLWEIWVLAALFLGIFGSAVFIDFLYRSILRERYQDYANTSYRRNPSGYSRILLLPWLNWGMSIALVALLAMAINSYAHFRTDSIVVNPILSFTEARHEYSDVVEVAQVTRYRAPNGDMKNRPHIAIRFANGSVWTSIEGGRSSDAIIDQRIVQILEDKTGLSPVQYDTFP